MFENLNVISLAIFLSVLIPLLVGLIRGITAKTVVESLLSMFKTVEFVFFIIISVKFTQSIFFNEESKFYALINNHLSQGLRDAVERQHFLAYLIVIPALIIVFMLLDAAIISPFYIKFFTKLAKKLQLAIAKMSGFIRHISGMIWNIPKALILGFIVSMSLNLFAYFSPDKEFNAVLNSSKAYEKVHEYAIKPLLQGNLVSNIPLILDDTFAFDDKSIPEPANNKGEKNYPSNVRVIYYFNGVTLDEAVKSDDEIDNFAKSLTKGKSNSKNRAKALYKWISSNIKYDEIKAKNISKNAGNYKSGAKEAYYTGKGICFDYASLYVAMCRANGIKVALVTGLGYNGINWGDHAWNKSFCTEENAWINVDPTFGSVSNYFDKKDFFSDHRYEKVRGEW